MSLLLVFVMMLGLIPPGILAPAYAADSGGVPQNISFAGETRGVHYWSPNWSTKQTYLQLFSMKDGTGQEYTGLCGDRKKGPPTASAKYTLDWVKSADEMQPVAWLLDMYFYRQKQGVDEWEELLYNSYAQVGLWFYLEGRLTGITSDMAWSDPVRKEQVHPLVTEREAALRA